MGLGAVEAAPYRPCAQPSSGLRENPPVPLMDIPPYGSYVDSLTGQRFYQFECPPHHKVAMCALIRDRSGNWVQVPIKGLALGDMDNYENGAGLDYDRIMRRVII